MGMTAPDMLDTGVLLQDRGRYSNEFNDIPSLTANDLVDSTSSDGVDTDNLTSEMYWNYDSGVNMDLMLNQYNFESISIPDINTVAEEWEGSVKIDDLILEQKPLLSHFEMLKESVEPTIVVMPEPQTSNDTNFDVVHTQTRIPGVDDLSSLQLFECPEDNLAVNDLPANLDLCSFINDDNIPTRIESGEDKKKLQVPKVKAGRKKIDVKAQRYIVENENEEEEIDVETVSESGNNPVLEAGDVNSLLEQFEAAAVKIEDVSVDNSKQSAILSATEKNFTTPNIVSDAQTQIKNKAQCLSDIKGGSPNATIKVSEQKRAKPKYVKVKTSDQLKPSPLTVSKTSNNKQIIEELPQELIERIRESGRRKGKGIAIIDPVPTSGGKKKKVQENCPVPRTITTSPANSTLHINLYNIGLDHSYCSTSTPLKKNIKQDSGYFSTEEEHKSLQNQPIVKNADGKLMISLLKVNTIRSNTEESKKKKLNIEEYKKRRFGSLNTPTSSLSNSPMSSNCSSPLPTEDENTRRLKHEEKLRKMALELLNTPPKSSSNACTSPSNQVPVPIEVVPPSRVDMDVITYVSIGVNTDITGRNPLAPAEKLEEIKPLLESASVKISSNSLITSLIENIPKVIKPEANVVANEVKEGHGEDKTIIYLPKKRKLPDSMHVGVQTSITLLGDIKRRYRRREDSTSSSSSSCYEIKSNKRSSRSQSSKYSKSSRSSRSTSISSSSSRSSFRTRSRSMSRSPSPTTRKRKREYIQEVEERRVIYVGKIAPDTTKEDLYYRFSKFGLIKTISLHFRKHGDNYGFVTFKNKKDAYEAFEHGNDDPCDTQYDLSFGGRRLFCKTNYSDLDNMRDDFGYITSKSPLNTSSEASFDRLLMEMQQALKKRRI